jgi:hypothetical protein
MTDYITEQELLDYIQSGADTGNEVVTDAIAAASRTIEAYCTRTFGQRTETTLFYSPSLVRGRWVIEIDDLATATDLVVKTDTSGGGTYATTLTVNTDFVLEPRNQMFGGQTGWPYTRLRGTSMLIFPIRQFEWQADTVKVTGTFGWPAVPDAVKQATKIVAAQYFKLAEAPLGVAGWGAYGDIRVRDIPQVSTLLAPFRKGSSFGIA